MRYLLPALLFLSALNSYAQPTINSNVIPAIGTTSVYLRSNGANTFNPGGTGANVTWNFATLDTLGGTSSQKIADADTTPYALSFSSVASRAIISGSGLNTGYSYTYLDNSKYEYYGFKTLTETRAYVDPQLQLQFPFTYNSQFTDTFYDAWPVYYGNATVKADAYGTLTLPTGTFSNVLRINAKEVYREYDDQSPEDSIFYEGQYYRWYQPNKAGVVLEYSRLVKFAIYLGQRYDVDSAKHVVMTKTGGTTAIKETENSFETKVYPNPAGNVLLINAETIIDEAEVTDIYGKSVIKQSIFDKQAILNLNNLAGGTYYVQLTTDDNRRKTVRFVHQ